MSPPPRRNPAALEYVGAATIAVAANAPSNARRVKPVFVTSVMSVALSRTLFLPAPVVVGALHFIHPQMSKSMTQVDSSSKHGVLQVLHARHFRRILAQTRTNSAQPCRNRRRCSRASGEKAFAWLSRL
jgi:hypothetical protein